MRRRNPQARTWRDYSYDLKQFVAVVGDRPPAKITIQDLDRFVEGQASRRFQPATINRRLAAVTALYAFLADNDPTLVSPVLPHRHHLREPQRLPRPVQEDDLRAFFAVIADARDQAMFILMLRCGLRTCEVRDLRLADLDFTARQARIQQSKGLKDRVVYLSEATIKALQVYLEVRGPKEALPEQVFIYRHQPLGKFYCWQRLRTIGERCGVSAAPHQLRHSCATLLLNAGAPVLTVQTILGHKWVDTTLGYARLYDGTVASDYYSAMVEVERRLALPEDRLTIKPGIGQLLALVDALRQGTLNATQTDLVQKLRNGLMTLAEQERNIENVKVPSQVG